MRILVDEFTQDAIQESFEDYGMDGECIYDDGEEKGKFQMANGIYEFVCHMDSSEIELTDLQIGISEVVNNSNN